MSDYAAKYPTIREWRRQILGDPSVDLPRDSQALDDAILLWQKNYHTAQNILQDNLTEIAEPPGFYNVTFLLASVCDIGPANIDPTPLTDCYQIVSDFRRRQYGKEGVTRPDATDFELREMSNVAAKCFAVFNRLSHAWVALETSPTSQLPDGPVEGERWRVSGETIQEKMAPMPWRLVNHLFHAPDNTASYEELAPIVADDHAEAMLDRDTCRGHQTKANDNFRRHGIPWKVSLRGKPTLQPDQNGTKEMP